MRVLFLHQNFPAQFIHLATTLQRAGHDVRAITDTRNARPDFIPTTRYVFDSTEVSKAHSLAQLFEARASRGQAVAAKMLTLRTSGFDPDIVIGHVGWGEALFVKDIWPNTKLVVYAEFYYAAEGSDTNFDPEFRSSNETLSVHKSHQVRVRNAAILLALSDADFGVAPTRWQASRFPPEFRSKIAILHEGIDTRFVRPPDAADEKDLRLSREDHEHVVLNKNDEIITFVNRNLEPYRGYHIFMRSLPAILRARPKAQVVIVGGDGVSYGASAPRGLSWKQIFLDEIRDDIDLDRVHFVGRVTYSQLVRLFQISSVHVYLTYPFVLSWSLLDAMSTGSVVVASRTPPVEEIIEDGVNGVLFDFFDINALALKVIDVLNDPDKYSHFKISARNTITSKFSLEEICLPKWIDFINMIVSSSRLKAPQ